MIGDLYKDTPISAYQPSKEVADLTGYTKREYGVGYEIIHRPWAELNDYSVIGRMNLDQRTLNAFVDLSDTSESEAWKWKGTRSNARNKAVAMHAQLTAGYLMAEVSAQNLEDEEDQEMADIMQDIMEWMTSPGNSNYQPAFLKTCMGMLANPVTYMGADYAEIYQDIKVKLETGGYTKKQIRDEVLSGFQAKVYSADQVLITNAYEQNIQKQRSIIKKRFIDYSEAEAQYKNHPNWIYVHAGLKSIYNESDGLFYDIKDNANLKNTVEESTHLSRRGDMEVCYINGIYMGDEDTEANPIKHRDNNDAPKYNVVPFGYQRVNEHFFYYKSMMNSLYWDNNLIDAMYENVMNAEALAMNMPTVYSGIDGDIDTDISFPGSSISVKDANFHATPLLPGLNPGAGFQAIQAIEQSMSEGSVTDVSAGQLPDPDQKAYNVAQATQNAKTLLAGVGRVLGESVVAYGLLMIDIAVTHLTVPEIEELGSSGLTKLNYKNFILNNKSVNGKKVTKTIKFKEDLSSYDITDQQKEDMGVKMAEEVGFPDNKQHLYHVNPILFAREKYMTRFDPEKMFPKNQEYQQAVMENLYTLLRQDPLIEPEELVRKLTYAFFRGEGEELMSKQNSNNIVSQIMATGQPQQPVEGENGAKPTVPNNTAIASPINANTKALSTSVTGNGT